MRVPSTLLFDCNAPIVENHQSAKVHEQSVQKMITSNLEKGWIAGPFDNRPDQLIVSPLASIPKKDTDARRVIHNLSFPYKNSVNSHIHHDFCEVQYETIDVCVNILSSLGKGAEIAKGDVENAFYTMKLSVEGYHFMGFVWKGQFFFQKTLPMGCAISCKVFERLTTAVQWILKYHFNVHFMTHILDDFMFFGKAGSRECEVSLKSFLVLAESLGLPIKHSKTVHPTTSAELHGIWFDTDSMTMSVPPDKLKKALTLIDNLLQAQKTTLRGIQCLTGLLNFLTRVVKCGRVFLRRLYDLTKGPAIPTRIVRITEEARRDLRAWKVLLQNFNGTKIISPVNWSSPDWRIYSDASGLGFGAVFGSHWIQGSFPADWKDKSIALKELVPVYLAMLLWFKYFKSKNVLFNVDNISVVFILNSQTSPDVPIMALVRKMAVIAMLNDITIGGAHIKGKHNVIPDFISRFQVAKAKELAPWLDQEPTCIPSKLLPW